MATWQRRQSHLNSTLKAYPRKIRKDAEDLVRVFLGRKSLKLRLCDPYLMRLWECSRRKVSYRLKELEAKGLIRRMTFAPRKKGGQWGQLRFIYLLVKKKARSTIARKCYPQLERSDNHFARTEPQAGKSREPKLDFKEYLSLRSDVPLRSFLYWARKWGANPRSMGYLRRIWERISNRPDLLESILWDAEEGGYRGREQVAFVVGEIKARVA